MYHVTSRHITQGEIIHGRFIISPDTNQHTCCETLPGPRVSVCQLEAEIELSTALFGDMHHVGLRVCGPQAAASDVNTRL